MGFLDILKGVGKTALGFATGGPLGAVSAGLGAVSQGQANNRGEKFGGQLDLERLLMARDQMTQNQQIDREQEGRASGTDAWRRLLSAQHTLSPGARPQLSPYSVAPRQATGAERQGADAMTQEVMARLQGGNPIPHVTQRPMNVDPRLLDAGIWEQLAGYGSAGLAAYGAMRPQTPPVIMNSGGNSLARQMSMYQAPRA